MEQREGWKIVMLLFAGSILAALFGYFVSQIGIFLIVAGLAFVGLLTVSVLRRRSTASASRPSSPKGLMPERYTRPTGGIVKRAERWMEAHPNVASAIVCVILLALGIAVTGTVWRAALSALAGFFVMRTIIHISKSKSE